MLNNHLTTHFYSVWNLKSLLKMLSKIKLNTFVVSKSTGMLLGALNFMKNYTNVLQTGKKSSKILFLKKYQLMHIISYHIKKTPPSITFF